jgi:hypothetical protein
MMLLVGTTLLAHGFDFWALHRTRSRPATYPHRFAIREMAENYRSIVHFAIKANYRSFPLL